MKLISCHISEYGNLKDKDIEFNDKLNSFFASNGSGKSTLASFIKAMFYGLENAKRTGYSERGRATPYSKNGSFGGNIVFEYKDRKYRIERFFGSKKIEDELKVYLNGKETDELGEEPGITIFGYAVDSFEKTLFISSEDLNYVIPEDLSSKIGHYENSVADETSFNDAIAKLEEEKKKYKPKNSADSKGYIAVTKNKISELENEQEIIDSNKGSLKIKYDSLSDSALTVQNLSRKLKEVNEHNSQIEQWETYDRYQASISQDENEIKEIKDKYPYGFISEEEERETSDLLKQWETITIQDQSNSLSNKEENDYLSLETKFSTYIPDGEEIESLSSVINHLNIARSVPPKELSKSEQELVDIFDKNQFDQFSLERKIEEYKNLKEAKQIKESKPTKKSILPALLWSIMFVALTMMASGIVLAIILSVYFWVLAGAGLILFFIDPIFMINLSKKAKEIASNFTLSQKEKERVLENEIESAIQPYSPLLEEGDLLERCQTIKSKYFYYLELKKKEREYKNENKLNEEKISSLESKVQSSFKKLGIVHEFSYQKDLDTYKLNLSSYLSLKERKDILESKHKDNLQQLGVITDKLQPIISKYHIENINDYFNAVRKDRESLKAKEEKLLRDQKELQSFAQKKNLKERPDSLAKEDSKKLQEDYETALKEKQTIENDISSLESENSSYENDVNELPILREELAELKEKKSTIENTIKLLKEAQDNLKEKYIAPIKDGFKKYSSLLEEALGKKVEVNSEDFSLEIEEEGKLTNCWHLSSGELTLCSLCYRLAIIDNIFPEEKPFIIFDDLFVNLDEEHLLKAKDLVSHLSEDRQIIYFTCHASRELKS